MGPLPVRLSLFECAGARGELCHVQRKINEARGGQCMFEENGLPDGNLKIRLRTGYRGWEFHRDGRTGTKSCGT